MADKFVVSWQDENGRRGVPIDERFYGDDEAAAKQEARSLLVAARGSKLMPCSVLRMTEEEAEGLVVSERPMEEMLPDVDFVILS